jgi:hypothetical protein
MERYTRFQAGQGARNRPTIDWGLLFTDVGASAAQLATLNGLTIGENQRSLDLLLAWEAGSCGCASANEVPRAERPAVVAAVSAALAEAGML